MKSYRNFVDGKYAECGEGRGLEVFNPAMEQRISVDPDGTESEIAAAADAAEIAQRSWSRRPAIRHTGHLRRITTLIRGKIDELARTIADESGEPLSLVQEMGCAVKCINCRAEWARHIADDILTSDRPRSWPARVNPKIDMRFSGAAA